MERGDLIHFRTASGIVTAQTKPASEGPPQIELDFPDDPPWEDDTDRAEMEAALGVRAAWLGRARFDRFIELDHPDQVRSLSPDLRRLAEIPARGVIVTAAGEPGSGADFISRFFAPQSGIDEDPVTGSAHCALGPFWAIRLGRTSLTGYQASRRGGWVKVRWDPPRVKLIGRAIVLVRGVLFA